MTQTATFDAQALQNSRITQLAPPAFVAHVWKSNWVDVTAARRLTGILAMNQPAIVNGVVIEQSLSAAPASDQDAHYWDAFSAPQGVHPVTGQAYYQAAWSIDRVGLFARMVVKTNGVDPTTFYARLIAAGIT